MRFVWSRPSYLADSLTSRRTAPTDALYDFERMRHLMPEVARPEGGQCFQSTMRASNLPNVNVTVVWDGGAEFPSISDACCSRIMRAQQTLEDEKCPLVNPCVMNPVQRFGGFVSDGPKREVWMLIELRLMTPDGYALPPVKCSVVPGPVSYTHLTLPTKRIV